MLKKSGSDVSNIDSDIEKKWMSIKMKLTQSEVSLVALTIVLVAPVAIAADSSSTITVSGRVIDNTCELVNADTPVTLDTVSAVSLINARKNDVATKDFSVGLKNCGAHATKVDITVTGTADSENYNAFKNEDTSNSAATGVAMDFYSVSGTEITQIKPVGGEKASQSLTADADNKLNFRAAYVGTRHTITAGSFKSVVKFTLDYE